MTELTEAKPEKFSFTERQYKTVTLGLILLLLFILPIASLKVGIPGDEPIDVEYGKASLRFYSSLGTDHSFENFTVFNTKKFPYQKYYGALFEIVSVKIASVFGTPIYTTRHLLVAICGVAIIFLASLFTAELAGWFSALIAVLLLASSPTFIGQSFFNSKDIPFALGFIVSFYFFVRFTKALPAISTLNIIGCIIGIALAVGVRMGGLLLISFLIVFLLYFLSENDIIRKQIFSATKSGVKFIFCILIIIFFGSLLGLCFYPNFFENGFSHISDSFSVLKNFPVKILILFQGELINAAEIPWYYLPFFMGITFPLTILIGLLFFYYHRIPGYKKITWQHFILIYTVLFIVFYVIITKQQLYNGWRHVLFIYPLIICSAAIGFSEFYFRKNSKVVRSILSLGFFIYLFKTVLWMIIAHPYEYVYFNELEGGLRGAYGYYDTDYQQLASSESYQWLINSSDYKSDTVKQKILLTNNIAISYNENALTDSMKIKESSFVLLNYKPMNYAIFSSIFLEKNLIDNFFPPKKVIHSVTVDGIPLSVVVKRENNFLVTGRKFFDESKIDSAFFYLQKSYEYDNNDFRVWPFLAHCYFLHGYPKHAIELCNEYLHYFPDDPAAKDEINRINSSVDSSRQKQ